DEAELAEAEREGPQGRPLAAFGGQAPHGPQVPAKGQQDECVRDRVEARLRQEVERRDEDGDEDGAHRGSRIPFRGSPVPTGAGGGRVGCPDWDLGAGLCRNKPVTAISTSGGPVAAKPSLIRAVDPANYRPAPLQVGVIVWLASELMFFSGLFAAYFSLRADT